MNRKIIFLFLMPLLFYCNRDCKIPNQSFQQSDLSLIPYNNNDTFILYDSLNNSYSFGVVQMSSEYINAVNDDAKNAMFANRCNGRKDFENLKFCFNNETDSNGLTLSLHWDITDNTNPPSSYGAVFSISLKLSNKYTFGAGTKENSGDLVLTKGKEMFYDTLIINHKKYDSVYVFYNLDSYDTTKKVFYSKSMGIIGVDFNGFKVYIK
jgi:hypothetical protein